VRDAVAAGLPGISPRTLGLIGSAERSGRLPFALNRVARDAAYRFDGRPGAELYLRWYPATLALVTSVIVTAVCVFVMPKFFAIFDDFGLELPRVTVLMAEVWEVIAIPLAIVVGLTTLMYVGRMLATILAPRLVPRGPVRWAIDQLKWRTPVLAGVTRWRALADVCHVMADALEAGHPLDYAVTEASRSGTNVVLAERLSEWADHTRAGQPPVEGAKRANMPAMLVGLLRTSAGADLADVLRFLARYYDGRFARSSVMLNAALVPVLSLVAGLIVGLIVLSLFLPLVQMIDHLSGMIPNI
jgi:type IV pilus assembly protein PilC